MKVVLFCGGLGMRIREYADSVPKPMIPIGYRPIIWHIMKYYSYFGHRDFVLCLGHQGDVMKRYFLDYNDAISSDFTLALGKRTLDIESSDVQDWNITFADTGLHSNIGQRFMAVRRHVENEDIFLANYGDVLTDAPLDSYMERFRRSGKVAAFLSVRPTYSFHVVRASEQGVVSGVDDVHTADIWLNGGYFMFTKAIFEYMRPGEELVEQPFQRLIADKQLLTFKYDGFWAPMDTLKDRQSLEDLHASGAPPWNMQRPRPVLAAVG